MTMVRVDALIKAKQITGTLRRYFPAQVKTSTSPQMSNPTNSSEESERPVRINVGGTMYTSSMETLTKYADSKVRRMFSGRFPIFYDSLEQKYFIDRDGGMFRHILNFLRNERLLISDDFPEIDLLLAEARFFEISSMVRVLEHLQEKRSRRMLQ